MLAGILFVTLTILFLAVFLAREYETSPATQVYDEFGTRLNRYLNRGNRQELYALTNRNQAQIIKIGLILGGIAGLLSVLLIGDLIAVVLIPLLALGGLLLFDAWVGIDYKYWQNNLADGLPTLIHFLPAFLQTGAITTRRALELTAPFLPEPLRSEMAGAVNQLTRTGAAGALDELARKAQHPVVSAVCFRLRASWDAGIKPDIFADLDDQIKNMEEVAAARATAAKSGMIALLCVIGLIGGVLEFGYPAWGYFQNMMGGMFTK